MKVGKLNDIPISFNERMIELQEQAQNEKGEHGIESPYRRWTQLNNEHTKELVQLALKAPKAHALLYFLVDQMDNYNAVVCSTRVLEDFLNVSRQTVSKSIKYLKDYGFIAVLKSGTTNVYVVNDKVY